MAYWYNIYHPEDYEAEIQVGLWDPWLQRLEHAPTQADRVLVHTDMMEQAHERRFAVCESGMNMNDFENDHSHRVKQTIDSYEAHLMNYASDEADDSTGYRDESLIGLTQSLSQKTYIDCTQFADHSLARCIGLGQPDFLSMLQKAKEETIRELTPSTTEILVADFEQDEDDQIKEAMLNDILAARKIMRSKKTSTALQVKSVRLRKRNYSIRKSPARRTAQGWAHEINVS